ncbi:TPM domain-containing protein [Reichenbachiella ulvae]|uniref:YgcG family protein n=1 Tax=Reichenbachiella ulvae TaxID=2980104 RepID=A0ABT3CUX3_9BACT|nr:YgcG family protein [Reichenbachiella ulvae]MCV9387500.1 YgcG family protein [Reichenbachiella ulvae]
MKIKNIQTVFVLLCFIFSHFFVHAADEVPVPELSGRVIDQTATLSSSDISHFTNKLAQFEQRKGSQLTVLILPTTGPETIEQYGIKVAEAWQIGRGGVDDGVILIVAKQDRKVRIEVGYGLEGAIPDIYAKRIIDNIIVPEFRNGQFISGIDEGLDALIKLVDGEELPVVTQTKTKSKRHSFSLGGVLIAAIIITVISSLFKNKFVKIAISIVLAIIVGFIFSSAIISIVTFVISLLFGIKGGRGGGGGGYYGGGYYGSSGGFGGFSGGGGFGGGGFSGGGGGFGGGGASGGW